MRVLSMPVQRDAASLMLFKTNKLLSWVKTTTSTLISTVLIMQFNLPLEAAMVHDLFKTFHIWLVDYIFITN